MTRPGGDFTIVLCRQTGEPVGELTAPISWRFTDALNELTTLELTMSLTDPLASTVVPGRSRVKVYRQDRFGNRALLFYGLLPASSCTQDAGANTLSCTVVDPRWLLGRCYTSGTDTFTGADVGEIVWDLISYQQGRSGSWGALLGHGTMTTGVTETTALKDRDVVLTVLETLLEENNCDWRVSPEDGWTTGSGLMGNVHVKNPQGTAKPDCVFAYGAGGGRLTNVSTVQRSWLEPVTRVRLTATPSTTGKSISVWAGTPNAATYGIHELQEALQLRTTSSRLTKLATAKIAKAPVPILRLGELIAPICPEPWTEFFVGDTVTVHAAQGAMSLAGYQLRVREISVTMQEGEQTCSVVGVDESDTDA